MQINEKSRALAHLSDALADFDAGESVITIDTSPEESNDHYVITRELIQALRAAIGSGRALLIRGEPGSGKSSFAKAAATLCDRDFRHFVVQPNTQYEDLLWSVDHVERLGEAQRMGVAGYHPVDQCADPLSIERFIQPGPLWLAFDRFGKSLTEFQKTKYKALLGDQAKGGVVLLIDEIDKADASVCNGLLEALGNFSLSIPPLAKTVTCARDCLPLIILTSNDLRSLPDAFMRRCAVIDLPKREGDELAAWLNALGETKYGHTISPETRQVTADMIRQNRDGGPGLQVGCAEYLDMLEVLAQHNLQGDAEQEQALLAQVGKFFINKR